MSSVAMANVPSDHRLSPADSLTKIYQAWNWHSELRCLCILTRWLGGDRFGVRTEWSCAIG
jgi:hypothetical protein